MTETHDPTTAMPPVIKLDGVTKVFVTDEVETHALANIDVEIARGEYVSIAGPSGCGKSTLLSILGLLDYAERRLVPAERPAGRRAEGVGARPRPQPRDRLHLPELQPDRRPHGVRERRAAAHLPRHAAGRAAAARRRRARARRHGAPREASARASCRAVSSSASPSRARSPASRSSCSPTSRPATSTRRAAKR